MGRRINISRIKRNAARGCGSALLIGSAPTYSPDTPFVETVSHTKYMLPSDNQGNLPACGGYMMANWIEWLMNKSGRYISEGYQVDGDAIWRHAREMFWKNLSGGLYMPQAFLAAVDMGFLVGEYKIISVSEVMKLLPTRPVCVMLSITDNWYSPKKQNGFIKEGGKLVGNHFVTMVGATIQDGVEYVHFLNSWGYKWGFNGIATLSYEHFLRCFRSAVNYDCVLGRSIKLKEWR